MLFAASFNPLDSSGFTLPSFLRLDRFKASSFLASLQATILTLLQPATIRIAINASGIRLSQGGWCSKLSREHQIALVASLVDLPRKDTKDVLEHIDILMEGRLFSKEVPSICRALVKIAPEKRRDVVAAMKELMTGREFPKEAPDMIRALANYNQIQMKDSVQIIKDLMKGHESTDVLFRVVLDVIKLNIHLNKEDLSALFKELENFSVEGIADASRLFWEFRRSRYDLGLVFDMQSSFIIYGLAAIQKEKRSNVLLQFAKMPSRPYVYSSTNVFATIQALGGVDSDEEREAIVSFIAKSKYLNNDYHPQLIKILARCPREQREHIIFKSTALCKALGGGIYPTGFIQVLVEISIGDAGVLPLVKKCFTNIGNTNVVGMIQQLEDFLIRDADAPTLNFEDLMCLKDLIRDLSQIPRDQREAIIAQVLELKTRPSISDFAHILGALSEIPRDQRAEIIEDVKEFRPLMSNPIGFDFSQIMKVLHEIPLDQRAGIIEAVKELMPLMSYSSGPDFAQIMKALHEIPLDQRAEIIGAVKEFRPLMSNPIGFDFAQIMKALYEISQSERSDIITQVKKLTCKIEPSETIIDLIGVLQGIAIAERGDVVEKTQPFIAGYHEIGARDRIFLLRTLASVSKEKRQGFIPWQEAIEKRRYSLARYLMRKYRAQITLDPVKMEEWLSPPCLSMEGVWAVFPLMKHRSESLRDFLNLLVQHLNKHLLEVVFQRIAERYPLFVRGKEERPDLVAFARKVLEIADNPIDNKILLNILELDFKLNQALPLSVEILEKIVQTLRRLQSDSVASPRFRLALQTHDNFEEIIKIAEGIGFVVELPKQEEFFTRSSEDQIAFMRRAQVFRDRRALPMAFEIIRRAVGGETLDPKLLQQSIHLLRKTEIADSAALKHLMTMIGSDRFTPEIRQCACRALAKVESNPTTSKRKVQLFEILKKERNPQIQTALVDCLSVYEYTNEGQDQEITAFLCSLAQETDNPDLKRVLACALTLMPDQTALKQALAIVNSSVWDVFDQGRERQDRVAKIGGFELFNYRPGFHDNRSMMRKVIVERLVTMYRESKKAEIERWLLEYRANPENFPNMKRLEEALYGIEESTRYIPFGIFLPENRVLLRGLSTRQGSNLLEPALHDFLLKGTGSADLWIMNSCDQATWAKVGQIFSSTAFSYVVDSEFCREDGFLFAINPRSFNQALLRHDGRFEREGGLHVVSYRRMGPSSIASVFVPQGTWQQHIRGLSGDPSFGATGLSQIQAERLKRKSGTGHPLQDRVVYFDPKADLQSEIVRLMQEQGLKAMTMRDIVEENLLRQALREMMAEDPEVATELQACIRQCGYLDAEPNTRVFGPINQPPSLITVNPRLASPIEVTVPIAVIPQSMTLAPENFEQIFARINQDTVNIPYPHHNDSQVIAGQILHRLNHNGTHSAKQTRFLEALFALMKKAGASPMQKLFRDLTQEERMHLFLATYLLRTGRVDESDFTHTHPDDFYTRSASIYEAYARQFSNNEALIQWVKKLIFNSVKPKGVREADIDNDPKNKLGYELLSMAHELDLIRCFGSVKIERETKPSLRKRLEALLPEATAGERERYLGQLMEFAKGLCAATGCKRAYDRAPGDPALFARCSTDGAHCWRQVRAVKIPEFQRQMPPIPLFA